MPLPDRPVNASGGMTPNDPWTDPEFRDVYPSLFSFLHDAQFSNGKTRLTGSLSIFTKFSVLTCAVNDNARGVTAFVNATTFDELLFKLEEGIREDTLQWRRKGAYGNTNSIPF